MSQKDKIITAILEIELRIFLTVNPMQTSGCQEYPESFKLHRRAQFHPWSEKDNWLCFFFRAVFSPKRSRFVLT